MIACMTCLILFQSLQIHEGGKRHKDNVAKKISELRKKGKKEFKAQKKFEDDMQRMEEVNVL